MSCFGEVDHSIASAGVIDQGKPWVQRLYVTYVFHPCLPIPAEHSPEVFPRLDTVLPEDFLHPALLVSYLWTQGVVVLPLLVRESLVLPSHLRIYTFLFLHKDQWRLKQNCAAPCNCSGRHESSSATSQFFDLNIS